MLFRALVLAAYLCACAPAPSGLKPGSATVQSPRDHAQVSDPFQVVGVAPGDWCFEGGARPA